MSELTVYFDGACILCSREVEHYWKQEGAERIRWVNIAHPDFDPRAEGLEGRNFHLKMHARRGETFFDGVDTFIEIWRELPRYRWVSRVVGSGLLKPGFQLGYEVFARVRPFLPKRKDCGSDACEIKL